MSCHHCSIVPPYLLSTIAQNHEGEHVGQCAASTLATIHTIHRERQARIQAAIARLRDHHNSHHGANGEANGRANGGPTGETQQSIIPHYLLDHIANADDVEDSVKESARRTLASLRQSQDGGKVELAQETAAVAPTKTVWRGVYNMHNREAEDNIGRKLLPGKAMRVEGQPASADHAVNEAYDNCGKVLEFYKKVFDYNSLDNRGMAVISSVHLGINYGNAYWDPQNQQMVYGDGDKVFLYNFTGCLDVIGHEMTHAITEKNSQLEYEKESGALNEHISDVFGVMVRQYFDQTTSKQSDWLVGEKCLLPGVKGVALRDMRHPGTAYDNPENANIGKDPQPADFQAMEAYKEANPDWADQDNGGVHLFSGIPNRAFVLCAEAFDGFSWEKAGQIWWITVTTNRISPRCTFLQFADATVDVAQEKYGVDGAKIVRAAWNEVGIVRKN